MKEDRILYIFLDEGGNLDFSIKGTRYFTITSITKERPFYAFSDLTDLKYDFIEKDIELEYFHASEDRQQVRNKVFEIINKHFIDSEIDSLIVEKRKTGKSLKDEIRFYPDMLGYLLQYVLNRFELKKYKKILIFTDTIPVKNKKKAIEKSIKQVLTKILPETISYSILHHSSKSNFDLQIVDYCNWAIYRKWEKGDERSYKLIEKFIKSEFDIFKKGSIYYY
jgi:hypothetical protein